jgi:hypothetical protein
MDIVKLRLSAMRSLWGIITPNTRKVSVQEKDNVISLYFYYDQAPSEEEAELSEDAATEVISDFCEPFLISCEREVINSPEKINFQGYLIYSRFEKND